MSSHAQRAALNQHSDPKDLWKKLVQYKKRIEKQNKDWEQQRKKWKQERNNSKQEMNKYQKSKQEREMSLVGVDQKQSLSEQIQIKTCLNDPDIRRTILTNYDKICQVSKSQLKGTINQYQNDDKNQSLLMLSSTSDTILTLKHDNSLLRHKNEQLIKQRETWKAQQADQQLRRNANFQGQRDFMKQPKQQRSEQIEISGKSIYSNLRKENTNIYTRPLSVLSKQGQTRLQNYCEELQELKIKFVGLLKDIEDTLNSSEKAQTQEKLTERITKVASLIFETKKYLMDCQQKNLLTMSGGSQGLRQELEH